MDIEFFQEIKQTYENENYDIRNVDDVFIEINNDLVRFKAWQDKIKKARQEICYTEAHLKEVEDLYQAQVSHKNGLELKLKEKQLEIRNFDQLKKNYLWRRAKAKATLSEKDILFMKSIENRLKAFRNLTGIIWNYSKCNADHMEGCITDLVSHRTKFFSVHPDPDQLWQMIDEFTKTE